MHDGNGSIRKELPVVVGRALNKLNHDDGVRFTSRKELEQCVRTLEEHHAHESVLRLLNRRDYSAHEVLERLARYGYDAAISKQTVMRAIECGLIDDNRYADAFIHARLAGGWGRIRIERELTRKGIELTSITGWPEAYLDEEDEERRALDVARTRRTASRNAYEKLVRYLMGKGFSVSICKRVARRVLDERDIEGEEGFSM